MNFNVCKFKIFFRRFRGFQKDWQLCVSQMSEAISVKEKGDKGADLSNFGNKWSV